MTERPESDVDRLLAENDALVGETIDPDVESVPGDDTEVEAPETLDPDLERARAQAPEHDPQSLTTEELRPEDEMIEYEPPDEPSPETAASYTAADELAGETIDDRLDQELPDDPV